MIEPTIATDDQIIPLCVTTCCREWVAPFGYPGGRCGLCDERPTFSHMLPEGQWLKVKPPIRP